MEFPPDPTPREGCDEFDNRLVGKSNGVVPNPVSEQISGHSLLLGKTLVESVDEDVRVNQGECGHIARPESNHAGIAP
jgi:hypothetical protein